MTDNSRPEPPVPQNLDLRDFKGMHFDLHRLRASKAWRMAKREPELAFYMMNLWMASWHEVPASSLENDDIDLCDTAGCDPKRWPKIRDKVLRGFQICSDGKLYHPVVAEMALKVWAEKEAENRERELRKMISGKEWAALRSAVFSRDGYQCTYCGESDPSSLRCDHVLARSRGGSNDYDNLTTSCVHCNCSKGAKSTSEWRRLN